MILPNVVRTVRRISSEAQLAFDGIFHNAVEGDGNGLIEYTLPYPKPDFFDHLGDRYGCVFHGSNDDDLTVLKPHVDSGARFRRQKLVFASPDGIWAMWYAVMDRVKTGGATFDAGMRLTLLRRKTVKLYFFALHQDAIAGGYPFTPGTVYILRGGDFPVRDTHFDRKLLGFSLEQWGSRDAVQPLARLRVEPDDFPYISRVQGFRKPRLFP